MPLLVSGGTPTLAKRLARVNVHILYVQFLYMDLACKLTFTGTPTIINDSGNCLMFGKVWQKEEVVTFWERSRSYSEPQKSLIFKGLIFIVFSMNLPLW